MVGRFCASIRAAIVRVAESTALRSGRLEASTGVGTVTM
jgi:hypothetical protein